MQPAALAEFTAHVEASFPDEACGVLLADEYGAEMFFPCRNSAERPRETFVLEPKDYLAATKLGQVIAICHSHPGGSTQPSGADLTACGASGLPWYIARWPDFEMQRIEPRAYTPPLLGRPFVHGVHDCYSLGRDYYQQELGIALPDFERTDGWWDNGEDLYRANFAAAGFVEVADLRPHDTVLMAIRSRVPNHAAIYLGNDQIMHHLFGCLSRREVFGGYWLRHKTGYLRHRSLA